MIRSTGRDLVKCRKWTNLVKRNLETKMSCVFVICTGGIDRSPFLKKQNKQANKHYEQRKENTKKKYLNI